MGLFNLFRKKDMANDIQEYLRNGAMILDVRTVEEWNEGHSNGAQLITLSTIAARVDEIKAWNKPVIAVCRSGARSGQATDYLKGQGIDIINGGPWATVDQYLK